MRTVKKPRISLAGARALTMLAFGGTVFQAFSAVGSDSAPANVPGQTGSPLGFSTNGPVVYADFLQRSNAPGVSVTNRVFSHFVPDTLPHAAWTNFMVRTNGRTTLIWTVRSHPAGWPAKPPVVRWNTNGLMWDYRGVTALSPCWENEGNPGQVPITALTRRHGYTRGHGMGTNGFRTQFTGRRVWFADRTDNVVEVKVLREVVRFAGEDMHRDYTIVLFDRDLPPGIEPLKVAGFRDAWLKMGYTRVTFGAPIPRPLFMTEQSGHVSANMPGFAVATAKGGDSGSPNLLALPGELVLFGGRACSEPDARMQADMDELCRREHLDPERYQMQWADLSAYPSYEPLRQ